MHSDYLDDNDGNEHGGLHNHYHHTDNQHFLWWPRFSGTGAIELSKPGRRLMSPVLVADSSAT